MLDDLTVTIRPVVGSGTPPQWSFMIMHQGRVVCHCSGPRVLVLETSARWVTLFEQESAPHA